MRHLRFASHLCAALSRQMIQRTEYTSHDPTHLLAGLANAPMSSLLGGSSVMYRNINAHRLRMQP
ncbi:hypothetical protein MPL1032_60016 [Mesorhizobium plurifarium]|uniref:Uncharacterized protein n=1 Tax=Mesorhizobium plurifarium TaxID=69974 RepID=A0A0K2W5T6_MESPL|nr:hypothetical protein MPL1032_60016 [Mesorhizobium plurifarium]